ncbi:hypothetical protein ACGFZP_17240 [Kitasatospora sp. NPDC048239]|uniref:hypothetical protein n=1 Tax=Kitasatospora sp. NPDC048239 TaxID=3364046 RepID=UPI00371B8F31
MNRSTPNRPAGVLAVLTLLAAVLGLAGSAAADPLPIGRCTTSSGVVLAVDLGRWGGPLLRSCGTTPTTGYALLNQGGWRTAGTGHDGPAFICRIGYSGYQGGKQFPPPEQEKCVLTPPATAYWSYWHADPGENTWSYSQLGAMSYHPKPGGVDLWIFGATDLEGTQGRPAYAPDTVRALNADPVGEGTGGAGSGSAAGGSTGTAGTTGSSGSTGSTGSAGSSGSTGSTGSTGGAGSTGSAGGSGAGQGTATGGTSAGGATGGGTAGSGAAAGGGGGAATGGSAAGGTGRKPVPVPSTAARTTPPPATGTAPDATATEPPPADPSPEQPAADPAAAVTPTDTPAATATDTPETASPTAAPSPSGTSRVVDADPVADAPHDAGSIAPGLVAVAIVLGLGLATLFAARRRRRQAD